MSSEGLFDSFLFIARVGIKEYIYQNYSTLLKLRQQIIQPKRLEEYFAQHLGERKFNMQPEMLDSDSFLHIIPPRDQYPIESPPEASELDECMAKFKNGRCQGTDRIFSKQLKYTTLPVTGVTDGNNLGMYQGPQYVATFLNHMSPQEGTETSSRELLRSLYHSNAVQVNIYGYNSKNKASLQNYYNAHTVWFQK